MRSITHKDSLTKKNQPKKNNDGDTTWPVLALCCCHSPALVLVIPSSRRVPAQDRIEVLLCLRMPLHVPKKKETWWHPKRPDVRSCEQDVHTLMPRRYKKKLSNGTEQRSATQEGGLLPPFPASPFSSCQRFMVCGRDLAGGAREELDGSVGVLFHGLAVLVHEPERVLRLDDPLGRRLLRSRPKRTDTLPIF